jgi:hypothetical protein
VPLPSPSTLPSSELLPGSPDDTGLFPDPGLYPDTSAYPSDVNEGGVEMVSETTMGATAETLPFFIASVMSTDTTSRWEAVRGGTSQPPPVDPTPDPPPAVSVDRRPVDPWLFEIVSQSGERLAAVPGRSRKLSLVRSGPGGASYGLTVDEAAEVFGMTLGAVDLLVSRGGVDIWRGPLEGANGQIAAANSSLEFAAVGVAEILEKRHIPPGRSILATEQTQMAWQLIADTQAVPGGDLGIVAGLLPDSVARSKTWDTRTPVRQAIDELAQADGGFDYQIVPSGMGYRFDAFHPFQGSTAGAAVLEWGRNIASVSFVQDASQVRNYVWAIGQNQISIDADDTASQGVYRLREEVVTTGDSNDVIYLGDVARGAVVPAPPTVPRLTLIPGAPDASLDQLGLGDVVVVSIRRGWVQIDGLYRIDQIDVSIPDQGGAEQLDVTVAPFAAL